MTPKPVLPRERAREDMANAVRHYRLEAGEEVALGLVDAINATLVAIATRPAAGSPRYGVMLSIDGLRSRQLGRYPYLVFYVERADWIEIWRVLHARRDIASTLAEPS